MEELTAKRSNASEDFYFFGEEGNRLQNIDTVLRCVQVLNITF